MSGYDRFVAGASQVGWRILVVAVTVMLADAVAMIVYTIRHGEKDGQKGKVVTENRNLGMSVGSPALMGRSKRKMLGRRSQFITDESLVDGTATFGQRMMVVGIITFVFSFFLVFVGMALILTKQTPIGLLFLTIPSLFLYNFAREAWHGHQEARKKVAARRQSERSTGVPHNQPR
jgi:1,4-dihydroxy-2-naphthoate octaprenyltransferase